MTSLLVGLGAQSASAFSGYTEFSFSDPQSGSNQAHTVSAFGYDSETGLWDHFSQSTGINNLPATFIAGLVPGMSYKFEVDINGSGSGTWISRVPGSSTLTLRDEDHAGIFVAPRTPATYSITMPTLYTASGRILASNGQPDPYTQVDVDALLVQTNPITGLTEEAIVAQTSGIDGTEETWSLGGLPPGRYVFQMSELSWSTADDQVQTTYNAGTDLGETESTIAPIDVTGNLTQDVQEPTLGRISGSVAPIGGGVDIMVMASQRRSDGSLDPSGESIEVQPNGSFTLDLPPGDWVLSFLGYDNDDQMVGWGQFYSGAWRQEDAQLVHVDAGETTTISNVSLTRQFPLSGVVTNSAGSPVAGVHVDVFGSTDDQWSGQTIEEETTTDATGHYSFGSLFVGAYYLEFDGSSVGYPDDVYTGTPHGSTNGADAVTTGSIGPADVINFQFAPIGNVTVHLATASGAALSGAKVEAVPLVNGQVPEQPDSVVATAVPKHPGQYLLKQLTAGASYTLDIKPSSTSTAVYAQWLGGTSDDADPAGAQTFVPTLGSSDLDATVRTLSVIGGTVRSTKGTVIKGAHIALYHLTESGGWTEIDATSTASNGKYVFDHEPDGSYALRITATGYLATFVGGGDGPSNAGHYYIGGGKSVTINASLAVGGRLTGFVQSSARPGVGVAGVHVLAFKLDGTPGNFTSAVADPDLVATTNSLGDFTVYGVSTGYYVLSYGEFDADGNSVGYADALDFEPPSLDALAVHVIAPATVRAPNATVHPLSTAATATVSAQVSGGPFNMVGTFVLQSLNSGDTYAGEIGADGSIGFDVVPGTYEWATSPIYDALTGTEYDPASGQITVAAGENDLTVSTQPSVALAFTAPPSVTPDNDSAIGTVFGVTASTTHESDAELSYQWLRDGVPIYGAQRDTYAARGVDVGSDISVKVTATWLDQTVTQTVDAAGGATILEGAAPEPEAPVTLSTTSPAVGSLVTAIPGAWTVPGVAFTYQWLADEVPIVGATSRSFTPTAAQFGAQLSVSVRATAPGYAASDAAESASALVGGAPAPRLQTAPVIKAVTASGSTTYTVSNGSWLTTGLAFRYAWFADGSPVGDTTNEYVAPTGSAAITAVVSTVKTGYQPASDTVLARRGVFSPGTTVNAVAAGSQPVTDAAQAVDVGQVLTVSAGTPSYPIAQHVTVAYQWQRMTKGVWASIKGATGIAYTVQAADVGSALQVRVTSISADYQPVVVMTPAGTGAAAGTDISGQVAMNSATAFAPGVVVSAALMGFPAGVKHSYVWQISSDDATFAPIAGAVSTTYTLPAISADEWVRLEVTTTRGTASVVQDATAQQVAPEPELAPVSPPAIVGLGVVGQTVSVDPGVWNASGIAFTYQWLRNGVPVPGATATSMVLPDDSYGDEYAVQVIGTKAWSQTAQVTTDAVKIGLGLAPISSTHPRIAGTLKEGSILTASTGVWNTDGLSFGFQWYAGATPIPGATNDTYTAHAADLAGAPLTVIVTATRPGFHPGTYQTAAYGTLG